MRKLYWYKECPKCGQGRLFIFKDVTNESLYLHCEECESGWRNPEKLDIEHSFLTLLEEFESEAPTIDEIREAGWSKYALHEIEE